MMKKTVFLVSAATWVVTGLAAAQPDFDAVEMTAYPVVGQVSYVEGAGGNIGLFVGEDGVFLIDDQYAPLTDKIVAAVRTVSDKPIRFLVNTHMHPDHTGGNENFGKMGTLIFGHDNVRAQMAKAGYDQDPPLVTYGDDMSFHINGETVYVFKTPDAHTNNDSYIVFKDSNAVHTGDIYRTTRARAMASEWVTDLRNQCCQAGVPFFFKQWGGRNKKRAGRLLEGRTWDQLPSDLSHAQQPALRF